jgi:AraC-like DNA-binding protein
MMPLRPLLGHSVQASYVAQLVQLVRRWGVTPADLLAGFGLTEDAVSLPSRRVPLATWGALLERARTLTGEPGLGFYLGLQKRISGYGYLGFAAMSAPSLREAIELVAHFSAVAVTSVSLRLHVEGRLACLVVDEQADVGSARDIALIGLLLGAGHIGQMLTGQSLSGDTELSIPEPAYFPRFKRLMPRARFGQPVSRVLFDAAFLDLPLVQADRSALQLTRAQCERTLDELGYQGDIAERVRHAVWRDGRDGFRGIDEVAENLAVSTRTLKRMLAAGGLSFTDLLHSERRERALFLLKAPALTLEEIAERLGYSTLSNFVRAFQQWTGVTPGAYRRSGRATAPALFASARLQRSGESGRRERGRDSVVRN